MHNEFQISIISEYNKIIGDSSNILTELDKSVVSIANIRLTYFNVTKKFFKIRRILTYFRRIAIIYFILY